MRRAIVLLPLLSLLALAYVSASAPSTSVQPREPKAQVWTSSAVHLPPVALPDIPARVWKLQRAERKWLAPQLRKSQSVVRFFSNPKYRWAVAPNQEKCWNVPWQRVCTKARAQVRLHHELAEVATWRLEHELPLINDWLTAVRFVQKIYPGTYDELYRLSKREGQFSVWKWYNGACSHSPCLWRGYHVGGDNVSGADTVGGWMQFRYSTFAPYWRHTLADLKKRGYVVPHIPMPPAGGDPKYAAWLSPLGQALTAGYMHWSGRAGCHWC